MRIFCVLCRQFLTVQDTCYVFTAGTCWPVGAAWCTRCCTFHGWHTGQPARG